MGNSLEEVRQKADFVCGGNQEDGAARFLAEYFDLKDLTIAEAQIANIT